MTSRRAAWAAGLTALLLFSPAATGGAVAAPGDEAENGPRLTLADAPVEVGDTFGVAVEGLTGPWDAVDVTSPALSGPLRLTPESKGATHSADAAMPQAQARVRSGISPGDYPLTAKLNGRAVATGRVKVVPQGPAEIRRFALEPKGTKARPGEKVLVVLSDDHAAPDEEAVTVASRAFGGSHSIAEAAADDPDNPACKCDDGATVYAARIAVPKGTPSGTYDVTVTSHHGQKKTTKRLVVAGEEAGDEKDSGVSAPWIVGGGAGVVVLAAGTWFVVSRRRGQ
ncbi:hypothetical protein [Streptomyces sp. XD-27]|uniref:hypothetical protein n=1 Tax=Streptomyces sp. XD-27 TaxID=3062779 RepID=UPI0026F44D09|nr:hypothetical protein [Streptomyces sp. XD-27]WKX69192.1 hypothetical protein Q3Y56_03970 [Streptomyces sp. XD-27]